jgi:hypothetical protein
MTIEKIKERIDAILKSQSELEQMVIRMQDNFFNELIINLLLQAKEVLILFFEILIKNIKPQYFKRF